MTSYTNVFGGGTISPAQISYISITLNQNITLSWPDQFQNTTPVTAYQMDVSPSNNGFTLTLPSAQDVSVGQALLINNPTGFSFALNKNDGTLLATISATTINYFYLIDNSTQGGTWRQTPFGGGYTAVTSINAAVPSSPSSSNLTITGVPITTTGTINFAFAGDLLSLISFNASTGMAARTAANTWALRTLTGTANQIQVTNGNGVAGNPTLALASTITGVTSLTSGNIKISANLIEAINANGGITLQAIGTGDISLDPTGTGRILALKNIITGFGTGVRFLTDDNSTGYFQIVAASMGTTQVSLKWPTIAPTAGQVLLANNVTPTQLEWGNAPTISGTTTTNAAAKYSNTSGSLVDTDVIIDNTNNITGVTSLVSGNISIGKTTANTIASENSNGNIVFIPNGSGTVQAQSNLEILPKSSLASQLNFYNNASNKFTYLKSTAAGPTGSSFGWTLPVADGAANTLLQTSGGGALSFTTLTTAAIPKVWAKVNTAGTALSIYGATVARDSAGIYTITFTTSFATSDYSVVATIGASPGYIIWDNAATGSIKIKTFNIDGTTAADRDFSVTICGNQ